MLPVAYSCGVSAPNTKSKIPFRTKAQIELFPELFKGALSTVEFTRCRVRNHGKFESCHGVIFSLLGNRKKVKFK